MSKRARVYVVRASNGTIKVGKSEDPAKRLRQLRIAHKDLKLELAYQSEPVRDALKVEGLAHRVLVLQCSNTEGEWFKATPDQARAAIRIAIRQAKGRELPLGGRIKLDDIWSRPRGGRAGKPKLPPEDREWLVSARKRLGWSMVQLARTCGLSVSTVANLERGKNCIAKNMHKAVVALEEAGGFAD